MNKIESNNVESMPQNTPSSGATCACCGDPINEATNNWKLVTITIEDGHRINGCFITDNKNLVHEFCEHVHPLTVSLSLHPTKKACRKAMKRYRKGFVQLDPLKHIGRSSIPHTGLDLRNAYATKYSVGNNYGSVSGDDLERFMIRASAREYNRTVEDLTKLHDQMEILLDFYLKGEEPDWVADFMQRTGGKWRNAFFPVQLFMVHCHKHGVPCEPHARVLVGTVCEGFFADLIWEDWEAIRDSHSAYMAA